MTMGSTRPAGIAAALLIGALSLSLGGCALPRIEAAVVDFQRVVDPLPKAAPSPSASPTAKPNASAAPAGAQTPAPAGDPATITAAQLAANTEKAVKAVSSVRMIGSVTQDGKTSSFELAGRLDMSAVQLNVSSSDQTMSIIKLGTTGYLKGNRAFWLKSAGSYPANVQNKWVKISGTKADQLWRDTPSMASAMTEYLKEADLGTVTAATLSGASVWLFTSGRATKKDKVYIDAATWLPVKVETTSGSISYSQWNAVPPVTAPPAGQTVTI